MQSLSRGDCSPVDTARGRLLSASASSAQLLGLAGERAGSMWLGPVSPSIGRLSVITVIVHWPGTCANCPSLLAPHAPLTLRVNFQLCLWPGWFSPFWYFFALSWVLHPFRCLFSLLPPHLYCWVQCFFFLQKLDVQLLRYDKLEGWPKFMLRFFIICTPASQRLVNRGDRGPITIDSHISSSLLYNCETWSLPHLKGAPSYSGGSLGCLA